jgi:hypothetical protein
MTEFINEKEHPTLHKAVTRVREVGWEVGIFKDGIPDNMVFRDQNGIAQTKDGIPIRHDDDIKLGVYRWVKKK